MKALTRPLLLTLASITALSTVPHSIAQPAGANYDESKVPQYTLPDPLRLENGKRVTDAQTWRNSRRPEILKLFETHVYGRSPGRPQKMHFETLNIDRDALGGQATRKEVRIYFSDRKDGPKMDLLIYQPNDATSPAPVFLGLNFAGNHTIHTDPGITLGDVWNRPSKGQALVRKKADESTRGQNSRRWPVEEIVGRGYALATVYYGDISPDAANSLHLGVHQLYDKERKEPSADGWGAIGAWAWGLSRAVDYLETDRDLDPKRIAVLGHSRLGKTSLWAGAQDQRFAIVISNNSGCGGAALSRRQFGETVHRINTSFPHWFCGNFKNFNNNEGELPVDQHLLLALAAPRPVYVASAEEDLWADPRGEFLAAKHAEPVFELLSAGGLGASEMPPVNHPVTGGGLGYHIRSGKHDVTKYDWEQYLNFADKHFRAGKAQQTSSGKTEKNWIPLFDGKSLAGWKVTDFGGSGEIEVKDGHILMHMGVILTGISIADTNAIPRNNYEVALEAKKVDGNDFFCGLTFPVADSHCTLVLGGWGGGVVGLSSIDGMDASENETTRYMEFEKDRWYRIRVRVTSDKLAAWLDDEQIVDQPIGDRKIHMRLGEIELSQPFGIAAYQTAAALRDIKVRSLAAPPAQSR